MSKPGIWNGCLPEKFNGRSRKCFASTMPSPICYEFHQFSRFLDQLRDASRRPPLRPREQGQVNGEGVLLPVAPFGENFPEPLDFVRRSAFDQRVKIGLVHDYSSKLSG